MPTHLSNGFGSTIDGQASYKNSSLIRPWLFLVIINYIKENTNISINPHEKRAKIGELYRQAFSLYKEMPMAIITKEMPMAIFTKEMPMAILIF